MPITYISPLTLLDVRGFLLKSYWSSKKTLQEGSIMVPSWESGMEKFLTWKLYPILESTPPRKIIAVFDAGNEYRTAIYPQYKGKRKARSERNGEENPVSTEQISILMEKAKKFMAYLGVKCVHVPGNEADDVIALLCGKLRQRITVHSVDVDLLQLASETVSVIYDDTLYQKGSEHKGVPTDLIVMHKSLVGDSSDEYPGVPGFGPAKWNTLVKEFGIDGVRQLEECVKTKDYSVLTSAISASSHPDLILINQNKQAWETSYRLATLSPDCCYGSRRGAPLKPVWYVRLPNKDKIHQLLNQIKAPDLLNEISSHFPTETLITARNHKTLQNAVGRIHEQEFVAFDFESYDSLCNPNYKEASKGRGYVDVLSQKITGISFCMGPNFQENYYLSVDHSDTENLSTEWASWLLDYLYTAKNLPIVQNANFELSVAKTHLGKDLAAPYDTQIMQSYVDENAESNLKQMTKDRFNYSQATYSEVTKGKPMNELSGVHVLSYGCDDSMVSAFHFDLQSIIMQLEGSWEFYEKNEVVHVCDNVNTFIEGTDIDFNTLSEMEAADKKVIEDRSEAIRKALEANCLTKTQEKRTEDAQNLLALWWELESAKLSEKGASPEEVQERYTQLWNKAWSVSVYMPYTETEIKKEFIPTKTKINNLFTMLGSELRVDKVTKNALTEWFVINDDVIESSSEEIRTFVKLLAASAGSLAPKKRSGEDYEALKSYAESLMSDNTKDPEVSSDGDELNFGSAPQMVEFLYGKLGLPLRARSKITKGSVRDRLKVKGGPATGNKASAAAIVYDLQDDSDWRKQVILDYMDIVKARQNVSLYYTPYPLWKSPVDGKIHPQLKNCGTVTRRPSGTAPNVLQVSAKDDAKIRRAYVPPSKKYAYVCLDFNGQELRITASESQDREMVSAYTGENRKDIHSLTASGFAHIILAREGLAQFSNPIDYNTYLQYLSGEEFGSQFNLVRKLAKAVNFLIIYGGGYTTLAQNLLIALEIAKNMMQSTFRLYNGLEPWQKRVVEFARTHGYVETAFGNRRHLTKDLYSQDEFLRMRQERQAVNATIQGCAADILKVVLSEMRRRSVISNYGLKALKPVYDEIASCVLVDAIPDYIEEMKEIMEITPPGHVVPMEIEAAIGLESWGGKVELGRPTRDQVVTFLKENSEVFCGH